MPIGTSNGEYFEDGMELRMDRAGLNPNKNPMPDRQQLYNPPSGNFDPNITDPLLDRPDPDPRMWRRPPNPDNPYDKQQRLYVTPIRDNPPEGPERQYLRPEDHAEFPLRRYPQIDTEDQNIINPGDQADPTNRNNLTRDPMEIYPNPDPEPDETKRLYPLLEPISGPAEAEPLLRHKVNAPEPNLMQKALGIGVQGDRYQMWPERAARGMAAGAQQEGQGIFHALTGMLNPNFEEDKQILQGFYNIVKNAFSLPGDVYGGKIDPMSKEGIERAADLAGLMVYGPAPVASRMADGSLGSFAGIKSKTADINNRRLANTLEASGMHKDDIWNNTGWFRAPDQRWKYEISDLGSHLKPEKLEAKGLTNKEGDTIKGTDLSNIKFSIPPEEYTGKISPDEITGDLLEKSKTTLGDILHHPELFKAYPHLKNLEVNPMSVEGETLGWLGSHNPGTGEIQLASNTLKGMHNVLMHEIQHAIQQHEGFGGGSNSAYYASDFWRSMMEDFDRLKESVGQKISKTYPGEQGGMAYFDFYNAVKNEHILDAPYSGWTSTMTRTEHNVLKNSLTQVKRMKLYDDFKKIIKGEDIIRRHAEDSFEAYRRSMGETEARNVQKRLEPGMMINPPWYTQDVPTFAQQRSPLDKGLSTSINRPRIPKNMQEELDQLMENRRTNRLMGYDTEGPDYQYYNDRIKELQSKLAK